MTQQNSYDKGKIHGLQYLNTTITAYDKPATRMINMIDGNQTLLRVYVSSTRETSVNNEIKYDKFRKSTSKNDYVIRFPFGQIFQVAKREIEKRLFKDRGNQFSNEACLRRIKI